MSQNRRKVIPDFPCALLGKRENVLSYLHRGIYFVSHCLSPGPGVCWLFKGSCPSSGFPQGGTSLPVSPSLLSPSLSLLCQLHLRTLCVCSSAGWSHLAWGGTPTHLGPGAQQSGAVFSAPCGSPAEGAGGRGLCLAVCRLPCVSMQPCFASSFPTQEPRSPCTEVPRPPGPPNPAARGAAHSCPAGSAPWIPACGFSLLDSI